MSDSKKSKVRRILEAIPVDGWVKASDLEEKTGISAHSVGALVNHYLVSKFVERRKTQRTRGGGDFYEYRLLRRIGKINRLERA